MKRHKRFGSGKERRERRPNHESIEKRPHHCEVCDESGAYWECDLIIGSMHKQAIATLVDRCASMAKIPFKTAQAVQVAMCHCFYSVRELF